MKEEVGLRFGKTTSAILDSKITNELNNALMLAATDKTWDELKRVDEVGLRKNDVSSKVHAETSQKYIALPWNMARLFHIAAVSPVSQRLEERDAVQLSELMAASPLTEGTPKYFNFVGTTAQWDALAADGTLTCKCDTTSNNSSVVSNRVVRVYYEPTDFQSGEDEIYEDLQGTFSGAGINLSRAANSPYPIKKVILPTLWKGDFTIEDGSANNIVKLRSQSGVAENETGARTFARRLVRIWPVPSLDFTMHIAYQRMPLRLVDDEDTPPIPVAEFLVERATAAIWRQRRNWEAARQHEQLSREILGNAFAGGQPPSERFQPFFGSVEEANGLC